MDEKKKTHLSFTVENLAMPEIHTGQADDEPDEETDGSDAAIPEIHFPHKKQATDN